MVQPKPGWPARDEAMLPQVALAMAPQLQLRFWRTTRSAAVCCSPPLCPAHWQLLTVCSLWLFRVAQFPSPFEAHKDTLHAAGDDEKD